VQKERQGGPGEDESGAAESDPRRSPPEEPDSGGEEEGGRGVGADGGGEPGEESREEEGPRVVALPPPDQLLERLDGGAEGGDVGEEGRAEDEREGGDGEEKRRQESRRGVVELLAEAEDAEDREAEEKGVYEPRDVQEITEREEGRKARRVFAGPPVLREDDVPDLEGFGLGGRTEIEMPAREDPRLKGVRDAVHDVRNPVEDAPGEEGAERGGEEGEAERRETGPPPAHQAGRSR
jgi:hypothetical protein